MTPQEEQTIRIWSRTQTSPPKVLLAAGPGAAAQQLAEFCNRFSQLVSGLKIQQATDDPFRAPAIIIGRHQNIAYQAVPAGKELEPFLEALAISTAAQPQLSQELDEKRANIQLPLSLSLYVATQCPHCPQAVRQLLPLAAANALVRLCIIDAALFGEEAGQHQIRSVPTLVLDEQFRWTGTIDVAEVLKLGIQRDPAQISAASLRQLLEAGEAPRAAHLMLESNRIFPALIDLLTHDRWSVRLGAMVAVEYLVDQAPNLSGQLIDPLCRRFSQLPENVQGDVVHVLGQIPDSKSRDFLAGIVSGDYSAAVKEAATEALAEQNTTLNL